MPTEETGPATQEEFNAWSKQVAQDTLFAAGCRMIGADQYGTVHMTLGMSDAEHAEQVSKFREQTGQPSTPMPGVTYLEDHWPK